MATISGTASDACRIHIYDIGTNTLEIDEEISAGSYSYSGLDSNTKWVTAMRLSDGKVIGYGDITGAGDPPVDAEFSILSGDDIRSVYSDSQFRTNQPQWTYSTWDMVTLRFDNVTIPRDSEIQIACMELRHKANNYYNATSVDLRVHGHDDAVAPTNSTEINAIRNTGVTATVVDWNSLPAGYPNTLFTTPSIVSLIQEIVDRPGWVSGSAIQLVIMGIDPQAPREFSGYADTYAAPKLVVRYQAP